MVGGGAWGADERREGGGYDGEGVWGPVECGIYIIGVDTTEFENVDEAFLAAVNADESLLVVE